MDVFDEELLLLWKALNKNKVKYIMVGGVATNLQGYQRSTEDVDIWIKDTLENRKKIRMAFNECEMGDFDQCYKMAVVTDVSGIDVPILHINHLIENKKAANRPKDQLDVIYLEKIKKLREDEGL